LSLAHTCVKKEVTNLVGNLHGDTIFLEGVLKEANAEALDLVVIRPGVSSCAESFADFSSSISDKEWSFSLVRAVLVLTRVEVSAPPSGTLRGLLELLKLGPSVALFINFTDGDPDEEFLLLRGEFLVAGEAEPSARSAGIALLCPSFARIAGTSRGWLEFLVTLPNAALCIDSIDDDDTEECLSFRVELFILDEVEPSMGSADTPLAAPPTVGFMSSTARK
jgi:hypothetical protein